MSKQFHPLDPDAEIQVTERHMPHWYQPGAAIFVTFRTADSIPVEVLMRWRRELAEWLEAAGLAIRLADSVTGNRASDHEQLLGSVSAMQRIEYKKLSDRIFHRSLDECHGACLLRKPDLAKIVGDAIRYFDEQRYDLDRFVVMPNHVHAIVQFRDGFDLETVSQSWMRYTGRAINRANSIKGAFWQPEPFDHIIRSENQFHYLQGYIADNPKKAKLSDGDFLYWQTV